MGMRELPLIGLLVLAAGCPAPPPAVAPPPCNTQIVTLTVFSSDLINPNEGAKTRPVVLRLYQLRSDVKLFNASYDDLLLRDAEVLGDDALRSDEVEVFPGDRVQVQFERNPEANFLAGVALFQFPRGQSYKTFYEFPLMPGDGACVAAATGKEPPNAAPKVDFYIDGTKLDNGVQYDRTMFPDSQDIRKVTLSKRSASPEAP